LSGLGYNFAKITFKVLLAILINPYCCTLVISLLLASCSKLNLNISTEPNNKLSVLTYTASTRGFMSNSHIILGEKEAILIDAQFIVEDAENVVDLILRSGRKLSKIIISHPHPDHYYGLEVIGAKFSDAEIVGGIQTINHIKNSSKYWSDDPQLFRHSERYRILSGESIKLDQTEIIYKIYKDSESIENTVLYIPSLEILFISDLASNKVHMWLAEGNAKNWLKHLINIQSIGPVEKIYPGHGSFSDSKLIFDAENYIMNFNKIVDNSKSRDEATEHFLNIYNYYEMPEILEGSMISVFNK